MIKSVVSEESEKIESLSMAYICVILQNSFSLLTSVLYNVPFPAFYADCKTDQPELDFFVQKTFLKAFS